jgi:hypothetical protein
VVARGATAPAKAVLGVVKAARVAARADRAVVKVDPDVTRAVRVAARAVPGDVKADRVAVRTVSTESKGPKVDPVALTVAPRISDRPDVRFRGTARRHRAPSAQPGDLVPTDQDVPVALSDTRVRVGRQ